MSYELDRARAALFHLDAGCSRDKWVRIGMAAKSAGLSFDDFHSWSASAGNYSGEAECRSVWKSFEKSGAVTPASLYGMAFAQGWKDKSRYPQSPIMRYKLLSGNDLCSAPPMRWMVRGVLPAVGIAALYGPSGSGKSFITLDIGAAVAGGAEWFGYRVRPAPVTYVCLEGEDGLGKRVKAWTLHHDRPIPDRLRFITQGFDLLNGDDVAELAKAINAGGGAVGLVIIDTLNRAAPGADENSSVDMGRLIAASKQLQSLTDGLVLLVHHSGKNASAGLRGHSSLYAALDSAIEVTKADTRREWTVAKSKDDVTGETHPFKLQVVPVGKDDDGEEITSCVALPEFATGIVMKAKVPKGATQTSVYRAINDLLRDKGTLGRGGAPAGRPCVEIELAIIHASEKLTCESDQRKYQARRAINSMCASGIYRANEGWLWLE